MLPPRVPSYGNTVKEGKFHLTFQGSQFWRRPGVAVGFYFANDSQLEGLEYLLNSLNSPKGYEHVDAYFRLVGFPISLEINLWVCNKMQVVPIFRNLVGF